MWGGVCMKVGRNTLPLGGETPEPRIESTYASAESRGCALPLIENYITLKHQLLIVRLIFYWIIAATSGLLIGLKLHHRVVKRCDW